MTEKLAIKQLVKDSLTEADGVSYDVVRILLILGCITFCLLSLINFAKFDPQSFGMGFGALLGTGGLGVGARAMMEKKSKE